MIEEVRMVSCQMAVTDIKLVDAAAKLRNTSRAQFMRDVVIAQARHTVINADKERAEIEAMIARALSPRSQAEAEKVEEAAPAVVEVQEAVTVSQDEQSLDTSLHGVPKECPVCGAVTNELGESEISSVRAEGDYGAWGCYACGSNGRWYDDKPWTIVTNTKAAEELPVGNDAATASL